MSATDVAAWWGAVVASMVLVWDVVKWARQGPKLRVEARANTYYEDGEVLSTQVDVAGNSTSLLAQYCHIEITNIGDSPTTILNVEATHASKSRNAAQMHMGSKGFKFHNGAGLPQKLGPGDSMSARLDMRTVAQLSERGAPRLVIKASHARRPFRHKIPVPKDAA